MPRRGAATRRAVGARVVGEILARSEAMKVPGGVNRVSMVLRRTRPVLTITPPLIREAVAAGIGQDEVAFLGEIDPLGGEAHERPIEA